MDGILRPDLGQLTLYARPNSYFVSKIRQHCWHKAKRRPPPPLRAAAVNDTRRLRRRFQPEPRSWLVYRASPSRREAACPGHRYATRIRLFFKGFSSSWPQAERFRGMGTLPLRQRIFHSAPATPISLAECLNLSPAKPAPPRARHPPNNSGMARRPRRGRGCAVSLDVSHENL